MWKDKEAQRKYLREYMRTYNRNPQYMAYRRKWMKEWHRKNAKKIYARRRAKPYEKLAATIRSRVKDVLKNGYYTKRTQELLGCSYKELKIHLENQFKEGMTWDNYGFYGWHADHIKPLSSFNLQNEQEQKKAFHFTNLQPLWAKENLQKYAKIV